MPDEFEAICKAYSDMREAQSKGDWERMRLLATITVQPHTKKKITPQALFSLPWDRRQTNAVHTALPTAEESKKRFEKLAHRTDAKK